MKNSKKERARRKHENDKRNQKIKKWRGMRAKTNKKAERKKWKKEERRERHRESYIKFTIIYS